MAEQGRPNGALWADSPSGAGKFDRDDFRLYRALRWVVEQISFGQFQICDDGAGNIRSLVIGEEAALEDDTLDDITERLKTSLHAVNIAGIFAQAREEGIEPKHVALAEKVTKSAGPGAFLNTEFYYAFELIDILKRIRERSFALESPPILGRASSLAVSLLGEATRCYLFGFNRACISLCRACLEKCLRDRVPPEEQIQEQVERDSSGLPKWKPDAARRMTDLDCLVSTAFRLGLLDGPHHDLADQVRRHGNKILHSKPQGKPEKGSLAGAEGSWEILCKTRSVVSFLFRGLEF